MSFIEEFDSLTFGELKHLSGDDIPLCLTKDTALRLCQESVLSCEATGSEVLHMWVNKLLKAFGITTFSTDEWCELLRIFQQSLKQLISTIDQGEKCESFGIALEELRLWLHDSLELIKCVQPEITQLSIMCICVLMEFFIEEILDLATLFKIGKLPNVFKDHMQTTISIQSMVLKLLNENMDTLAISNTDEFSKLTELIISLCEVGAQSVPLDFKTILETWKCVAKLVTHCTKYFQYETRSESIERQWVERPINFLLKEAKRNLIVMSKRETLAQSVEQLDKYLRVTNFYLKLLLRLATDFSHSAFPAANEFFDTFKIIHDMLHHLGTSKISEMLEKYVHQPLNDMLLVVYKNSDLQKCILDAAESNAEFYNCLIRDYLRACISGNGVDFINENGSIFVNIFEHLFKTPSLFIEESNFDSIIRLYTALVCLTKTSVLKEYFIKNILTGDICKSHASTEVLLTVSCCSAKYATSKQIFEEFCFWRAANEKFSLFSANPRKFQVHRLLRNALNQCKSLKDIPHNKLCEQQVSVNNAKFFLAVGLQGNITNSSAICTQMNNDFSELSERFDTGTADVESYYKTVTYLKLYMLKNEAPKCELIEKLLKILMRLYKETNGNVKQQPQKLLLLVDAILDLAVLHISIVPFACLQQFLGVVSESLSMQHAILSAGLLKMLNVCRSHANPVLANAAQSIQSKIVVSDIFKSLPCMLTSRSWEKFKDTNKDMGIYKHLSLTDIEQPHSCANPLKALGIQSVKRQRLDEGDECNIKFILSDVLQKSQQLANAKMNLDQNDISTVAAIIDNLNKVICKK